MYICYTWVYQYIDHPYHWIYYDRILINILTKYGSNIDENPVPNSIGGMNNSWWENQTWYVWDFTSNSLLGIPSDMETPELAYSQGISSPLKNRGGQTLPLRTPQCQHNRSDSWAQQDSTFRTRKKHVKTYRIYRTYQNSSIIQRSPLPHDSG